MNRIITLTDDELVERTKNSIIPLASVLSMFADHWQNEASTHSDQFNKGYFEGKAELAKIIRQCLGTNDVTLIRDIINGNI